MDARYKIAEAIMRGVGQPMAAFPDQRQDDDMALRGMASDLYQADNRRAQDYRAGIKEAILQSWPAELAKSAYGAVTLPGDVYAGKVNPMSDEAVGRSAELAGLMTLGAGAIRSGGPNELRMGIKPPGGPGGDDAARMARAKSMGYDEGAFYRGDKGKDPSEYPRGAHFTRNPEYNAGGSTGDKGFGKNREFRLNLQNAFLDENPVTAKQLSNLLAAAQKHDPKLAVDLASLVGRDQATVLNYGRVRPDAIVDNSGHEIRAAMRRSAAPQTIFKEAGFDAVGNGHEVLKLTGDGIRLSSAQFDPAKAHFRDITAGLAGAAGAALTGQQILEWAKQQGVQVY
jgi:hypothetical protein